MDNFDNHIEDFMTKHKDIFDTAKWAIIEDVVNNIEAWKGNEEIRLFTRKVIDIFKKYDCDPDVVSELFTLISDFGKEQSKNDISEIEMTAFVSVLDKLRKKGKEDASEK